MNFISTLSLKDCQSIIVAVVIILMTSCSKEDENPDLPTPTIMFSNTVLSIEENSTSELEVDLSISGTLDEAAIITINTTGTATSADYSTDPATKSGAITLNIPKGATSAKFTITAIDNSAINEDKTLELTLISVEGGLELANSNQTATLTIINDDIIPANITTSVTILDDFGYVDNGNSSDSKSYTVTGTALTSDISILTSDYFQVSLDNVSFSSSVEVPFANANSGPVDIFVQFIPTSGNDEEISGTITHSSIDGDDVVITVNGMESGNAAGGLLLNDNFDYGSSAGDLTALSAWENYSGTGFPIQYTPDGLAKSDYGSSDIGGAITIENGDDSREDVTRSITSQTSGVVYTAQLIRVSSATASESGDFFLSLRDPGGKYFDRLYAKDDGDGNLLLGTARTRSGGGLEVYSASKYSYNTTYLVVIKYDFSTMVTSMYVFNSSIPEAEPETPDVVATTGDEPTSFEDIIIRQSTDDMAVTIDGIRIAKSWADVLEL